MSETIPADQPSASVAGPEKAERLRLALVAGGIVFALTLAVVLLRLYRLSEIPPALFFDEGAHGLDALRVLQGEHAVFFPENYGREGLIVYAVALAIAFLGRTLLAVRLPTALASAGTVYVVFWLGRLLFGKDESGRSTPWRGLLVGGVSAGLLAVSIGQTIIGRTAWRANFLPLLLSLCFALLWWGWQQRSWQRVALAGVCAGLLPYTYIPARFAPFLFLFFGLSFLLPFRSVTRKRMRVELPWVGIFLGVAALVAAPLFVHFALHPEHFFIRSSQLWVFDTARSQGDPLAAFLGNVWGHLSTFGFRGDPSFHDPPLLNPWEAFFFWLGVALAVWRWQRRPAYRLLLLWLGVLILPALLAREGNEANSNTLRMIGAVPAIYLLIGVGVWEACRFLQERYFQKDAAKAAFAMGAVVSGLILAQAANSYHTYFQKMAHAPEAAKVGHLSWTILARTLNAQPSDSDLVYLIPSGALPYGFKYLYLGKASVHAMPNHIFHPNMTYLGDDVESTLANNENVSMVKVVEWNAVTPWIADDPERFAVLLGKYGRYLGRDEYARFQVHNFVAFYQHLEPLTVHYDGGIALLGLAVGQGEEQLSSRQLLNLGQDRSLWVGLQWQTASELEIDYAISLRLYNAEGKRAYQTDDVLWKSASHRPTSHWSANDLVDSLFWLDIPGNLPPGEYELRLVVYNFETQTPTVQIGVWVPELTLARLRVADFE